MNSYKEPTNTGVAILIAIAALVLCATTVTSHSALNHLAVATSDMNLSISIFLGLMSSLFSVWTVRRFAEVVRQKNK